MRGLIAKLDRVRERIRATGIHDINSGGCCVIASAMAEVLDRLGVPYDVVTPVLGNEMNCEEGRKFNSPSEVRDRIKVKGSVKEWNDNGVSFAHVAVRFQYLGRLYIWDTEGLYHNCMVYGRAKDVTDAKFGTGLTLDEAYSLASTSKGWNWMFDRDRIPELAGIIRVTMLGEAAMLLAIEHCKE